MGERGLTARRDVVKLPSGFEVDLANPNISAIRSADDAHELMMVLQAKIIEIEGQLDQAKSLAAAGQPYADPTWFSKASKALRWTKMARQEAQDRYGRLRKEERQRAATEADRRFERAFIRAAKERLAPDVYAALVESATAVAAHS